MGPREIHETFAAGLDESVWTPSYLPAWSSASEAAATWTVGDEGLRLSLPPEHPLWCPDLHEGALRVSGVQSGNWSGPVGSMQGQQPFRDGLVVREQQAPCWGFTPHHGRVEVECRATVGPRSMFSAWMVGVEDVPERSGEICLVEVFGDTIGVDDVGRAYADVGSGIHPFRDRALREEFAARRTSIDVADWHRYAVEWSRHGVRFFIDDELAHETAQSPDYPMQLILAVFDFPDRGPADAVVPELVVRRVRGTALER
ncbi:glycosyl hydrolase family protein [Labedella phragmitis]|uniref:Glycosyl hydrolase family protein n=1 Tax=Labedella phragmitis TaxID=2498849 RepID=A0A444PQH5_9MICO|nr:glycoside hydrolase family 16 protein [Labedella phragmitis]RWZ46630.1 glycosyl hydrolase family protein [Labedella phragmitis]